VRELRQGFKGLPGLGEADDRFGSALDDGAGVVILIVGRAGGFTAAGGEVFSEAAIPDSTPEELDLFGSALAFADFSNDGWEDIAVGARGETFASVMDHGVDGALTGDRRLSDPRASHGTRPPTEGARRPGRRRAMPIASRVQTAAAFALLSVASIGSGEATARSSSIRRGGRAPAGGAPRSTQP